eukprot:jgi/Chlat1/2703/Chrsp180S02874
MHLKKGAEADDKQQQHNSWVVGEMSGHNAVSGGGNDDGFQRKLARMEADWRLDDLIAWIEHIVGERLPVGPGRDIFECLKDGVLLCRLANVLAPGSVPRIVRRPDEILVDDNLGTSAMINQRRSVYQSLENATSFLNACRILGVSNHQLFAPSDLHEKHNPQRIIQCLVALSHVAPAPGVLRSVPSSRRISANGDDANFSNALTLGLPLPVHGRSHDDGGMYSRTINDYEQQLAEKDRQLAELRNVIAESTERHASLTARVLELESRAASTPQSLDALLADEVAEARALVEVKEMERAAQAGALLAAEVADMRAQIAMHERQSLDTLELQEQISRLQRSEAELREQLWERDQQLHRMQQDMLQQRRQLPMSPQLAPVPAPVVARTNLSSINLHPLLSNLQALKSELNTMKREASSYRIPPKEVMKQMRQVEGILQQHSEKHSRLLLENRNLYNTIQDLKGAIRVFCRLRPLSADERATGIEPSAVAVEDTIMVKSASDRLSKKFNFDRVYDPSSSQEQVFAETQPLIRSVMDGYNVCILAYGQTGSGKTFTMAGPSNHRGLEELKGVNYRALDTLFAIRDEREAEWDYSISVEVVEIYNETVRDLLSTRPDVKLDLRVTEAGGRLVDVTSFPVRHAYDVVDVMAVGEKNRAVGATNLNERSSRSHCVVTVRVEGTNPSTNETIASCLNLVDLAGSERVSRSEAAGERLKEAQHINRSLSALGDVMAALVEKRSHVPFRNSKLTTLLADSLGGNSKVLMFAQVNPDDASTWETLSTLNFAARVKNVELGKAGRNVRGSNELKEMLIAKEEAMREELRTSRAVEERTAALEKRAQQAKEQVAASQGELERISREMVAKKRELEMQQRDFLASQSKLNVSQQKDAASAQRELQAMRDKALYAQNEANNSLGRAQALQKELNQATKELAFAQAEIRTLSLTVSRLEDKLTQAQGRIERRDSMSNGTISSGRSVSRGRSTSNPRGERSASNPRGDRPSVSSSFNGPATPGMAADGSPLPDTDDTGSSAPGSLSRRPSFGAVHGSATPTAKPIVSKRSPSPPVGAMRRGEVVNGMVVEPDSDNGRPHSALSIRSQTSRVAALSTATPATLTARAVSARQSKSMASPLPVRPSSSRSNSVQRGREGPPTPKASAISLEASRILSGKRWV